MSDSMDFVSQEYWDNAYSDLSLDFFNDDDPIVQLINCIIEQTNTGNVFEIGCFPGRYLKVFGEKGFVLNGIDTTPRIKTDLVQQFEKKNYRVGKLIHGNIFEIDKDVKY